MLTRNDTWISFGDMVGRFSTIPRALPNAELRAQVSNYFAIALGDNPNRERVVATVQATIREHPELLDYYIRLREETGDEAEQQSLEKVRDTFDIFVEHRSVAHLTTDIETCVEHWNDNSQPYVRTKTADHILDTLATYCQRISNSAH